MPGSTNMMLSRGSSGVFSAELSSYSVQGHRTLKPGTGGTIQTANAVLCTPVNGVAPFTYMWTYSSGDTEVYANTSTSNQTYFSAFFSNADVIDFRNGAWICTITDATSATAISLPVSIQLFVG